MTFAIRCFRRCHKGVIGRFALSRSDESARDAAAGTDEHHEQEQIQDFISHVHAANVMREAPPDCDSRKSKTLEANPWRYRRLPPRAG